MRDFFTLIFVAFAFAVIKVRAFKVPEGYDSSSRPNAGAVADVVNVSLVSVTLRSVSEDEMELTMDMVLRLAWMDPRLGGVLQKEQTFTESNSLNIWSPDIFVLNSGETQITPKKAFKIKPDGSVILTQRFSPKVSCLMSFIKFPFERQDCHIKFQSFGYNQIHLDLMWNGILSGEIPNFDTKYAVSSMEQTSRSEHGINKSLILILKVSRKPFAIIWSCFLPTLLLALGSYLTLFLNIKKGIIRKANIPSSSTQAIDVNSNTPRENDSSNTNALLLLRITLNAFFLLILVLISQISYKGFGHFSAITGFDVWMSFMGAFILAFFIQGILLYYEQIQNTNTNQETKERNLPKCLKRLERILKLGMPIILFLFFIVYFAIYLS